MNNDPYIGQDWFQYTIVIPAYNEAERIGSTLDHIVGYIQQRQWSAEIIVVDDGSTDTTAVIVWHYAVKAPFIRVIRNAMHRGKGWCVRTGITNARGPRILIVDADLPASMQRASSLLLALDEGADIAIASRWLQPELQLQRQSLVRQTLSRCFNCLTHVLLALPFKDTQCGLKAFTRDAARLVVRFQRISGWVFDAELLVISQGLGLRIQEIPIQTQHDGRSRLNPLLHGPEMLSDILRIVWSKLCGDYPKLSRFRTNASRTFSSNSARVLVRSNESLPPDVARLRTK